MKKFDTSFRGYDKKQVNSFVGDVADKYESMLNNLKSRDQQIQELQNKLEYYKKMEETLNRAIFVAEDTSNQIKKYAKEESTNIINEAKRNASRIINEALLKSSKIEQESQTLKHRVTIMKSRLRQTLEEEIRMNINEVESKMKKAIENMENRFLNVRAGRANPAMLNGIEVDYYGTPTPINSLANVTVPEAKQLFIKPFDKSTLKEIERSINEANIGISPTNNGEFIILTVPDLTEDRRREYVKQVKSMAEDGKVALRNIRQDANNAIKKLELPEDQEKGLMEDVQELINKYNKIVDEKAKEKEKELMQI